MILPKKQEDFPVGTPLFGVCTGCKAVLPYPPVQIPQWIKPGAHIHKWEIKWLRFCFSCAAKAVRNTRPEDLVPEQTWDSSTESLTDNPYRR